MPSVLELTADELISRGIAPVKKDFILPFIARQQVEAVASSATAAGTVSAKKKSKGQIKRERSESSKAELCINFALGRCSYGAACRFSHDTAAYLASKQPDLPGSCPFSLQEACPYGVTCRWAGTHKLPPPQQQQQPDGVVPAADTAASQMAAAHAANPAAADNSAAAPPARSTLLEPAAQQSPLALLPLIRDLQRPVNVLSKELQQQLWKHRYDFSKADAVLEALGCTNHGSGGGGKGRGKRAQQGRGRGGGGGIGATAPADTSGSGLACPQQQQQQQQQQVPPQAEDARVAGAVDESCMDGPRAKRRHVHTEPAAAVVAETWCAGAASAGEPEVAPAEQATAAAAAAAAAASFFAKGIAPLYTAMEELDGLYEAADVPAEVAAAAEPSAISVPGSISSSDASFLAGLTTEQQQQRVGAVGVGVADALVEPRSRQSLDIAGMSYLAPLTTVGNLPFRRLCVGLGCEVTCGEMALATNLLQGQASEWALLKRHPCEKLFGVQVCGGYPDAMSHLAQLLDENISTDFVDINCGCPIDIICERGAGSALLTRPKRLEQVVRATTGCIDKPVIVKIRKGYYDNADIAHNIIPQMREWGAAAVTLHGRSRQQRYSRAADWEYIRRCAGIAAEAGLPLVGNGDVFSYSEWATRLSAPGVATAMIGRAALIKPWIFTEIAEQRLWDISASERLELLKTFTSHGLEHWGSDSRGVEATRRFLLEWLSFTHRYIPVGLLEVTPQLMQWRPPAYRGRNELETLLASESAADWVCISEMLLGPAPPGFTFAPKHKSNAYAVSADAVAQLAGAAAGTEAAVSAAGDAGEDEQENG